MEVEEDTSEESECESLGSSLDPGSSYHMAPGRYWRLSGIVSRPELNGRLVTVLAHPDNGRVPVSVRTDGGREDIRVKVSCLIAPWLQ